MRDGFRSSVRGAAVFVVILALTGSASAASRDEGRERKREQGIIRAVKKVVRALGDGLIIPIPKPNP
jgi:hypothetical protein